MQSQDTSDVDQWVVQRCLKSARATAGRLKRRVLGRPEPPRRDPLPVDVRGGSLDALEHVLLRELVEQAAQHGGPIIEIGTLIGSTTSRMALWKAPGQRLLTVDNYCWNPWRLPPEFHFALASEVLLFLVQSKQVEQLRMDKADFFNSYDGPPPSLVFLDAIHSYEHTKIDIEWARRVGAAVISGHDYKEEFPGVIQVVKEFGGPVRLQGSVWSLH